VDNILIAFDPNHTNIQAITQDFNNLHPKLQFTAEPEKDNTLNYLDIPLNKTPTCLKTSIYRKSTFTDTIIPYTSNHPTQHKYAAIRFLYNRLHTYDLEKQESKRELNTIQNILHNNSFPLKYRKLKTHTPTQTKPTLNKWATFTYNGKETSYITNLFKHTNLKIAFRTNNTIGRLLTPHKPPPDKFSTIRNI
jgi:hypothetical protein